MQLLNYNDIIIIICGLALIIIIYILMSLLPVVPDKHNTARVSDISCLILKQMKKKIVFYRYIKIYKTHRAELYYTSTYVRNSNKFEQLLLNFKLKTPKPLYAQ